MDTKSSPYQNPLLTHKMSLQGTLRHYAAHNCATTSYSFYISHILDQIIVQSKISIYVGDFTGLEFHKSKTALSKKIIKAF